MRVAIRREIMPCILNRYDIDIVMVGYAWTPVFF